jgi:hypothetical protein
MMLWGMYLIFSIVVEGHLVVQELREVHVTLGLDVSVKLKENDAVDAVPEVGVNLYSPAAAPGLPAGAANWI